MGYFLYFTIINSIYTTLIIHTLIVYLNSIYNKDAKSIYIQVFVGT